MLYSCQCKITENEEGTPKYSQNWVKAKSSTMKVYKDKIEAAQYSLDLSAVEQAHLYLTSSFFFIPGKVIQLKTSDKCYQIALNPWSQAHTFLTIPLTKSKVKLLGYPFSSYPEKKIMLVLGLVILGYAYIG
jgi:hypothetical protein